jgi:hypothetical protein
MCFYVSITFRNSELFLDIDWAAGGEARRGPSVQGENQHTKCFSWAVKDSEVGFGV